MDDRLKDVNERQYALICGESIRQIRENSHYTQTQLADMLEISVVSLGRIERGQQAMKLWRLIRFCDLFHVSVDSVVRGFGASPDSMPVPSYLVKLYQDADTVELEILADHMQSAGREIDRKHSLERRCLIEA